MVTEFLISTDENHRFPVEERTQLATEMGDPSTEIGTQLNATVDALTRPGGYGLPGDVDDVPTISAPATVANDAPSMTGGIRLDAVPGGALPLDLTFYTPYGAGGMGLMPGAFPNNYFAAPSSLTSANGSPLWGPEFIHRGTVFDFFYKGTGAVAWALYVNGCLITPAMQVDTDAGGGARRVTVTFPSVATRHILVVGVYFNLFAIAIGPDDGISPAPMRGRPQVIFGDSFVEGTGADDPISGLSSYLGQLLGWPNTWVSGSGGTGYINPGAGGRVKFADRIVNDVTRFNPSDLIIAGGYNDLVNNTAEEIGAAADSLFATIRAAVPDVRLRAVSPWSDGSADGGQLAAGAAIKAAVEAHGGTYLDLLNPMLWTAQNSARLVSTTVPPHPSSAGHLAIAVRLFELDSGR